MKVIIYTDGASRGNPGHSSCGFSISNEEGEILYEEGKYLGLKTNNFAEYSAVLNALDYAKDHFNNAEITFYMDSKLVAEQLSNRYKIRSPNLIPLVREIKALQPRFKLVTYNHIRREFNTKADQLANQALDSR